MLDPLSPAPKARRRTLSTPLSPAAFRARIHLRVSVVYWMTLAGLLVWTVLVTSGFVPDAPPIHIGPFCAVLTVAAVNLALRSWERLRRVRKAETSRTTRTSRVGWVFVTVDMLLIAVGLQVTGGFQSPLWVVVFLVGGAETILARPAEAYLIRYGAILALLLGTLPFPVHQVTISYYLEMGVRIGCFIAVNSVTRRLRETNDSKERENAALRAEITLIEERSNLSREVHDGIGNSLAASVLRLEFAARSLEKASITGTSPEETVALLKDEAQALRDAMRTVRDWAFFTRPWSATESVSDSNLLASTRLQAEIERLSQRTALKMRVDGAELIDVLLPAARLALLRIVQEALTNAAKHAQGATGATVTLQREAACLVVHVTDDGAGFGPETKTGAGIGIASMQERAAGIGAVFSLDSSPGHGTTLAVRIPIA